MDSERPGLFSAVLIVSPLISLMESQVKDLHARNQNAMRLSAELTAEDEKKLASGLIRYLFCSPETLDERKWKTFLSTFSYNKSIKAVFIDEAHCMEAWSNHSRFAWLLEELRTNQIGTIKTIVFCRSIADCADLYQLFDLHLKEDGYMPRGNIQVCFIWYVSCQNNR